MPLYTEEQLSMILSAHAAESLVPTGALDFELDDCDGIGCINQIAFNEPDNDRAGTGYGDDAERAARWFDSNYRTYMPVSRLLHKLESF